MKKRYFEMINFNNGLIESVTKKSLENGFRVVIFQSENINQIFVENKEKNICTIHYGLGGLNIGTVHKPNRETGTGFSIKRDLGTIHIKTIDDACNTFASHWAGKSAKSVNKYDSIDDYVSKQTVLKYREVIL